MHVMHVQCQRGWTVSLCSTDPHQFPPSTATATPTVGEQLMLSIEASPLPTTENVTLNGSLVTDVMVNVTTTSLTIANVTRNDSGEYQITASNVAGSATFTLTVDRAQTLPPCMPLQCTTHITMPPCSVNMWSIYMIAHIWWLCVCPRHKCIRAWLSALYTSGMFVRR